MPSSKRKTLKTIKNKEGIHPYSRKAQQVTRAVLRTEKLAQKAASRSNNPKVDRWTWFQYALDDSLPCTTKKGMHELIEMYIARHDDELEELRKIQKARRRSKTPRQDLLEAWKQAEENEYISGMDLPDLTIASNVEKLREWDGDANSMALIKTARFRKQDAANLTSDDATEMETQDASAEKSAGTDITMDVDSK